MRISSELLTGWMDCSIRVFPSSAYSSKLTCQSGRDLTPRVMLMECHLRTLQLYLERIKFRFRVQHWFVGTFLPKGQSVNYMTSGPWTNNGDKPRSFEPFYDFPSFKVLCFLCCLLNFFQTMELSWVIRVQEVRQSVGVRTSFPTILRLSSSWKKLHKCRHQRS